MSQNVKEQTLGDILQKMSDRIASLESQVRNNTYRPGHLMVSAIANLYDGWLPCDGAILKRTEFPNLSAVLSLSGYPYGAGDGSTTFGIPNLLGRFPMGADPSNASTAPGHTAHALGQSSGDETILLTGAQSGVNGNGVTPSGGGVDHTHFLNGQTYTNTLVGLALGGTNITLITGGSGSTSTVNGTGAALNHTHTLTARAADSAHNNNPPFTTFNFFIKI